MLPDLPRIAVTMGDPAGVGPEVCLRLLSEPELAGPCRLAVFGDAAVMSACAGATGIPFESRVVGLAEFGDARGSLPGPVLVEVGAIGLGEFEPGTVSAATGRAGFAYVEAAIDAALAGRVAAVVTAPLNKEALAMAGVPFPGHSEIFAERTGAKRWCMMQYSEEVTCTFVTVHVGYRDVPALLTVERVLEVIELTAAALAAIRRRRPKIAVLGLNPHAGEHGLFGDREEERVIVPAIGRAAALGIDIEGPLPPDTAFLPWKRASTDAFVCMYHDQGHIPVKALAFDSAVNTTLGLPVVRTSVDHGTALDIAWQGKARPHSLYAAVRLALRLAPGGNAA